MTGRSCLPAIAAATLLLGILPPSQASQPHPKAPALAGVTTIIGNKTAVQEVRLTSPVDPAGNYEGPVDKIPGYDLRGDGRIVGFVLTQVSKDFPLGQGPTLYGWSLGRCMQRGCEAKGFLMSWVFWENTVSRGGKDVLPKGTYRLYLIADGAPARIRLELDGLRGRRTITPHQPANSEIRSMEPQVREDGAETLYWTGARSEFEPGGGFSVAELWVDGPDVQGAAGSCTYTDTSPPPEDVAYVPPCPTADLFDANMIDADYNEVGFFDLSLPQAMGLWRTVPQEPTRAGAVAFWLEF